MEEENSLIGKQIGNYILIEEIASGSYGTVYRAHHHILSNRVFALKLLHMNLPVRERERFKHEAQLLDSLQHRHILSVVDIGFDNGRQPYLALAYASGGSLRQRLSQKRLLPWDEAHVILKQIGEALHYAHQQNIVHCDLKPENILFNAQGEAVLADFGIAIVLSTMSVKVLSSAEGTPPYMAPEQFHGHVSKESDQYALGCIAYELITGQRLFSAPNLVAMVYKHEKEQPTSPRQINPHIPVHVEDAILKALAKQRNDRHSDIAAFLSALQMPPTLQRTKVEWFNEGNTLRNLKKHRAALEAYDHALRLDPNYAGAYNGKGNVFLSLNRYKEALLAYSQALRLDPKNADIYNNKGIALRALQRHEEALQAFEQALRLNPNFAYAYNGKGNVLLRLKRYEEALFACEQALRLDHDYVIAYDNKGNALYNLKRYEEALEAYKQASRLDPKNAEAYNGKGMVLNDLQRYEEALDAYEQALRVDPNNAVAYNNRGNALYNIKRYKEALLAYEQALRIDAKFVLAYAGKGVALHHLERYEEALKAYEQALRLDPKYALTYSNMSMALDCLGRKVEAQQARKKARELGLA